MKDIYLKTPNFEELSYRKKILADKETMTFNNHHGGTIDFDESKWEIWYNKWIGNKDKNFYYAYIIDKDSDLPVGEVAYRLDEESNSAMLNIIIEAANRGSGYGSMGLKALIENAFKNGYDTVRDMVYKDSTDSHALFEKIGFKCVAEKDECKDYRMTIDEYVKKYGEL